MSEVLQAKLNAHIKESNRRHDGLEDDIKNLEKELRAELANKVPYKTFMLIFTILSAILGYMIWQMDDIRKNTNFTALNLARIHDVNVIPSITP